MKDRRGTPMAAKSVDVLDRILPTARRWTGPDVAECDGFPLLPDDAPSRLAALHRTRGAGGTAPRRPDDAAPDGGRGRVRKPPRLARMIETEVVPRLVLAGRAA